MARPVRAEYIVHHHLFSGRSFLSPVYLNCCVAHTPSCRPFAIPRSNPHTHAHARTHTHTHTHTHRTLRITSQSELTSEQKKAAPKPIDSLSCPR
eukprot:jgi/Psemu1/63212/estExt_Genemark1.C_190147